MDDRDSVNPNRILGTMSIAAVPLVMAVATLSMASCSGSRVEHQPSTGASVAISPSVSNGASPVASEAGGNSAAIVGQTIYVPIYSHIYMRDKASVINLTATLSVRNTDVNNPIRVTAVSYYGTHGTLVRQYLSQPLRLAPMASVDYVVAEDDTSGGAGANFIVEWDASVEVTQPVAEAVMISTASQQGISFVSVGRVIKERATK